MSKGAAWVAVAFVASLVACGHATEETRSQTLRVSTATQAAQTARFETTTWFSASGSHSVGTITGAIDFTHHRGFGTMRNGGKDVADTRWIGAITYERAEAMSEGLGFSRRQWMATDYRPIASLMGCEDVPASPTSMLFAMPSGYDRPDQVLAHLQSAGASLDRDGHDRIRGIETTHWHVQVPARRHRACTRSSNHDSKLRFELWTDTQDRLRRTRVTSTQTVNPGSDEQPTDGRRPPKTAAPTTFTFVQTTDLYDFGLPVDVEPPPPSDVYDQTDTLVSLIRGNGKVAAGAWRVAARGEFDSRPWTVWYARTTTGWRCYDTQGAPAQSEMVTLEGFSTVNGRRAEPPPKHDGRRADCTPGTGGFVGPLTTYIAGADAQKWALVARADGDADHLRLRFPDGSSATVPVDRDTRLVIWNGPATRVPRVVEVGERSCRIEAVFGSTNACQTAPYAAGP